eukprot:3923625-Amphidinium_carterae.1
MGVQARLDIVIGYSVMQAHIPQTLIQQARLEIVIGNSVIGYSVMLAHTPQALPHTLIHKCRDAAHQYECWDLGSATMRPGEEDGPRDISFSANLPGKLHSVIHPLPHWFRPQPHTPDLTSRCSFCIDIRGDTILGTGSTMSLASWFTYVYTSGGPIYDIGSSWGGPPPLVPLLGAGSILSSGLLPSYPK